jgi:hypothetical protein
MTEHPLFDKAMLDRTGGGGVSQTEQVVCLLQISFTGSVSTGKAIQRSASGKTHARTHMHARTRTHAHARTHAHSHARTHAYAHACIPPVLRGAGLNRPLSVCRLGTGTLKRITLELGGNDAVCPQGRESEAARPWLLRQHTCNVHHGRRHCTACSARTARRAGDRPARHGRGSDRSGNLRRGVRQQRPGPAAPKH